MANAKKVVIDGKEYELDKLSNEVKNQLANLNYVEAKLADLKSQEAVFNAAKMFYSQQLKAALEKQNG